MKNIYKNIDEMKLLKRSKLYIDAMAQGINPLTGEFVSDSVISDGKIQSCLEYVSFVLDNVIDKGGITKARNREKNTNENVVITREQIEKIKFSKEPIGITETAKRINEVIDESISKRVTGPMLANMMVEMGYIGLEKDSRRKITNEKSKKLGITTVQRKRLNSDDIYEQVVYSEDAQKFIAYHLIDNNK